MLAQPARFNLLYPQPLPHFNVETMQEHTAIDPKDQSKFQDKKLGGIIFPGVEKWGSGEFGPEAQWESCEVVCKARVFV